MSNDATFNPQVTPHVLSIGEALIDVVIPFDDPSQTREIPGGSPANVAMTLGRLDRPVVLQTWFGDDPHGRIIREHFEASHVHIPEESGGASRTTTAQARLDANGAATYTFDMEWDPVAPIQVHPTARIVHAGSISSTVEPGAHAVLDALIRARQHALITFDPNARPAIMGTPEQAWATLSRYVAVSDVVKVSDEDIEWLTGGRDIEDVASEWLNMGPQLVIVTRGSKGALARTSTGIRLEATPRDVAVVDTVGAGDSFMGAVLDAMWTLGFAGAQSRHRLRDLDTESVAFILERATQVSSVTVSRAGANPPWTAELSS